MHCLRRSMRGTWLVIVQGLSPFVCYTVWTSQFTFALACATLAKLPHATRAYTRLVVEDFVSYWCEHIHCAALVSCVNTRNTQDAPCILTHTHAHTNIIILDQKQVPTDRIWPKAWIRSVALANGVEIRKRHVIPAARRDVIKSVVFFSFCWQMNNYS